MSGTSLQPPASPWIENDRIYLTVKMTIHASILIDRNRCQNDRISLLKGSRRTHVVSVISYHTPDGYAG